MSGIIVETRKTYRAPNDSRRYLTKDSAYRAWAKGIILARYCECEDGEHVHMGCDCGHLFKRKTTVCSKCHKEMDFGCLCKGSEPVAGFVECSDRYRRLCNRLARWIKRRDMAKERQT